MIPVTLVNKRFRGISENTDGINDFFYRLYILKRVPVFIDKPRKRFFPYVRLMVSPWMK